MGEFDSNPVAKSLQSYHEAKSTGASDGSAAGNLGLGARRKEQSSWSWTGSSSSSSKNTDSKLICTELMRQGLMSREDRLLGARYVDEYLADRHMRGYHVWALPAVRHMRRSRRATAFWRVLAQARADHIAFVYGDASRRSRLGALLCALGHPACGMVGRIVAERDWQALYKAPAAHG